MGLTARANRYIIGNDTMMIISFLVVLTRLYYRRRHSPRGLWWDDLFIVISLVGQRSSSVLCSVVWLMLVIFRYWP